MAAETSPRSPLLDLRDPMQVGVRVLELDGNVALLQQQVSQSLGNVSSQLSSLQGEVRAISRRVGEVVEAQHGFQSHSSGLERVAASIENHVREFGEWRKEHEKQNQMTADTINEARGGLRTFVKVSVIVGALIVFTVQLQFQYAAEQLSRAELRINEKADEMKEGRRADATRFERENAEVKADINEIKKLRGAK